MDLQHACNTVMRPGETGEMAESLNTKSRLDRRLPLGDEHRMMVARSNAWIPRSSISPVLLTSQFCITLQERQEREREQEKKDVVFQIAMTLHYNHICSIESNRNLKPIDFLQTHKYIIF